MDDTCSRSCKPAPAISTGPRMMQSDRPVDNYESEQAKVALAVTRKGLDVIFGRRSAARHEIESHLHSLHRLESQQERYNALASLTPCGEVAIGRRIALLEEQLFAADASAPCAVSITSSPDTLCRIQRAARTGNVPLLIQEMLAPSQTFQLQVQLTAVEALLAASQTDSANNLHILHAGGVQAVTAAMQHFSSQPALQRNGAALLMNLAFLPTIIQSKPKVVMAKRQHTSRRVLGDVTVHSHNTSSSSSSSPPVATTTNSNSNTCNKITRVQCDTTDTCMLLDLTIVKSLVRAKTLECLLAATEFNLFQVQMSPPGSNESENYCRVFAKAQIVAQCRLLLQWHQIDDDDSTSCTSSGNDKKIGSAFSFVRRCLASLVDDPSIAPDTLDSFLYNKR